MNRHQQRVALLFGLLLISIALLGCADSEGASALQCEGALLSPHAGSADDAPLQFALA
jgi:hypothetical protein